MPTAVTPPTLGFAAIYRSALAVVVANAVLNTSKKVFGILRKCMRSNRAVTAKKSQSFKPPSRPAPASGLFVFNFEILHTNPRRGNAPQRRQGFIPPTPTVGAAACMKRCGPRPAVALGSPILFGRLAI